MELPAPTGAEMDLRGVGTVPLAKALLERMSLLVRKEVELARAEMAEDLEHTKTAGGLGGGALAAGVGALCCGLIAAVEGLGLVMPRWLAALCLFALFLIAAAVLGGSAWKELRRARPERTLREAKATVRMLTERHA